MVEVLEERRWKTKTNRQKQMNYIILITAVLLSLSDTVRIKEHGDYKISQDTIVCDFRVNTGSTQMAVWRAACYEGDDSDPFFMISNFQMPLKDFAFEVSKYCKYAVLCEKK